MKYSNKKVYHPVGEYYDELKRNNIVYYYIKCSTKESETLEYDKLYIMEGFIKVGNKVKFKIKGLNDRFYYPGKFMKLTNDEIKKMIRNKKLKELGI